MWNPRKTLVLHNSRETLARLLIGGYDTCAQPIRWKMDKLSIPSMLLCMVPGVSHTMIEDDQYGSMICNVAMLWPMLTSSLLFSFWLKSFFSLATFAKCSNQDSNCVYAGTILWHKGWYDDTKMIWYVCNGRCGSLMCTSKVADNTQMASLDRQVTQNG